MKTICAIGAVLFVAGCQTTQQIDINDKSVTDVAAVNPVDIGQAVYGEHRQPEPTPDDVVVGIEKDIIVNTTKQGWSTDSQFHVMIQQWDVEVMNVGYHDLCVGLQWKLMGFRYIAYSPSFTYVPHLSSVVAGKMEQQLWVIDGTPVTFPPSGYLERIIIRQPNDTPDREKKCEFIVNEDEITSTPNIEE